MAKKLKRVLLGGLDQTSRNVQRIALVDIKLQPLQSSLVGQIIDLRRRKGFDSRQQNDCLCCFLGRLLRSIAGANREMTKTKNHDGDLRGFAEDTHEIRERIKQNLDKQPTAMRKIRRSRCGVYTFSAA